MLSDKGSVIIQKYGLLNTNMPQGHPFYGIPFPGDFLLATNGTVKDKLFLPDYQTRPSASEVLLKEFGATAGGHTASIRAGEVEARVTLSSDRAVPGQQLGVAADFAVEPGWHIYGEPLPDNYVATAVTFDPEFIASASLEFPKATPVAFKSLGETLPVYSGKFRATGRILVKPGLKPGNYKLKGTLTLQECNDQICKLPQKIAFELPITIAALVAGVK